MIDIKKHSSTISFILVILILFCLIYDLFFKHSIIETKKIEKKRKRQRKKRGRQRKKQRKKRGRQRKRQRKKRKRHRKRQRKKLKKKVIYLRKLQHFLKTFFK